MVYEMIVKSKCKFFTALLLVTLVPFFIIPTSVDAVQYRPVAVDRQQAPWSARGPFVDRAIFKVITGPDEQVQALVDNEIDHLAHDISEEFLDTLAGNPDIELTRTERLGFGFMAINCERYPYNIPAFRRALALAVDKHEVATAIWGDSGFAIDNPVLAACGAWHNSQITPDFRDSDIAAARAELAQAGFRDRDGDGFVEAPNGDSFTFRPMHSIEAPQWEMALNVSVDDWEQAGIRVVPMRVCFCTLLDIVYTIPRNYDAACYAFGISPNPLFLENFISSEIRNPEGNMLNWGNYTFDDLVETMLSASNYTDVLAAAHQAQQVFVENAPMVVLYSHWMYSAHRTDKFDGWIVLPGWGTGPLNRWTPRKVRLKEGHPERYGYNGCGGTYSTLIASAMDSQNPLTSTSVYGGFPLAQVYSRLTGLNDANHLVTKDNGGMAYDWVVEPHPNGLKYTFTLYDNATWHDMGGRAGGFVTADDVEFSYNYILDHNIPTYSRSISYLNSCRGLDDTHVEIITNSESYWAFDLIRGWVILPEHIWAGIVSPVTFTNPHPIGSGPFQWHHRVEGEYVELHYWENYHRGLWCCCIGGPDLVPSLRAPLVIGGIAVIAATLVVSALYLRSGSTTSRRLDTVGQAREEEPLKPTCLSCGAEISGDDRFCASCGQQVKE
jgi:ABC-type transport system substrate-binding protein